MNLKPRRDSSPRVNPHMRGGAQGSVSQELDCGELWQIDTSLQYLLPGFVTSRVKNEPSFVFVLLTEGSCDPD